MENELKLNDGGDENITTEIKNESVKSICENTINEKKWKRNCPQCNRELAYYRKGHRDDAVNKNKWCNKCRANKRKIEIPDGGWSKLCPICKNRIIYSTKRTLIRSIKCNSLCQPCILQKKKLIVDGYKRHCNKCGAEMKYSSRRNFNRALKNNGICFDCNSKILGEKLRYRALERIKKSGIVMGYNPHACKFIDEYGKQNGYNFQHALNGGEVIVSGHSLDGYDKEKNVIFEYDEPHHYIGGKLKVKDIIRQKRIIGKINPSSFLRYDEKSNKLYDVISSKTILI